MKIGIATVHDSSNFGSFLQAFALQEILRRMGHTPYFILTRDAKYVSKLYRPSPKQMLRHPTQAPQIIANARKKHRCFLRDQACFQNITLHEADGMDLILLGSDEIWNVCTPAFTLPCFYGIGAKAPKVAFAVSAGRATTDDLRKYPELVKGIQAIDVILPRDNATAEIVHALTGTREPVVGDPTLLVDPGVFGAKETALAPTGRLVVYAYSVADGLRERITAFAKARGLKVVSLCFQHAWVDENIICGPMQFCRELAVADYVFTTTFHGTIFSILNHKRFVSHPTSQKTTDLLFRLGLEERVLPSEDALARLLEETTIDYQAVESKINLLKSDSLRLLTDALERVSISYTNNR